MPDLLRKLLVAFLLSNVLMVAPADAQTTNNELFPIPAELQPDVDFWLSIFTQYNTREGVLHDNRYLGVVYEQVALPENVSRRQRQRIADQRRRHFRTILQTLAGGKRDNLSVEEMRV